MKKIFTFLCFSLLLIATSCSVEQKDLIGNWTGNIVVPSQNPNARVNAEISLYFEDSIELKGNMVLRWNFGHGSYDFKPDTYVVPFIYKIEGHTIHIEGRGAKYTASGESDSGLVKFKLKYEGNKLVGENATIPSWDSKNTTYSFTLTR